MDNIAIYGAGGTAVNILKRIKDLDLTLNYIDTSMSNMRDLKAENIFLVEDEQSNTEIDGFGKNRKNTFSRIKDQNTADSILTKFPPSSRLNIVLSSLSGGTGNVISFSIVRELVKRNCNTIVIGVDSRTSIKEIDNSINALKSFKSITDTLQKSVSIFYVENTNRKEADNQVIWFITLMSLLMNKKHVSEFDTGDLRSFLNFESVTDNNPTVSIIEINANSKPVEVVKNTTIVGSILVSKDEHEMISEPIPEYHANCVVLDPTYDTESIRIDSVLGKLSLIIDNLDGILKTHKDNKKMNKFKEVVIDNATDDGIVL